MGSIRHPNIEATILIFCLWWFAQDGRWPSGMLAWTWVHWQRKAWSIGPGDWCLSSSEWTSKHGYLTFGNGFALIKKEILPWKGLAPRETIVWIFHFHAKIYRQLLDCEYFMDFAWRGRRFRCLSHLYFLRTTFLVIFYGCAAMLSELKCYQ